MKKEDASSLLLEVLSTCKFGDVRAFIIDRDQHDCVLSFNWKPSDCDKESLNNIAEKRRLKVEFNKGRIILRSLASREK